MKKMKVVGLLLTKFAIAYQKAGLNIIRDKKGVQYRDNIKEFEQRLGRGDYIILVISDKFLKSRHCMFKVLNIIERKDV